MDRIHSSAPQKAKAVLQVQDLQVYYGESHALQGVSLSLERGVLSVVGRNGMGKTTLCNAIVGLMPVRSGSIRFEGRELVGVEPHQIARAGVGRRAAGPAESTTTRSARAIASSRSWVMNTTVRRLSCQRSRSSFSTSIPGTLPTRSSLLEAFWGWVKK